MCRMLIAIGRLQVKQLIEDLRVIAQGKNELHEKNPVYGKLIHGDGWGMAYLDQHERWTVYKSLKPIYEDDHIECLDTSGVKALILHARKATVGSKSIDNTQPFVFEDKEGKYIFMHNGTVKDNISPESQYVKGTSDSARWFNSVIHEMKSKHKIRDSLAVEDYTSANFILVTPEKILVGQNWRDTPVYSTMKILKEEGNVIVSSEVLPDMKGKNWKSMDNHTTLELKLPR